MYSNKFQICDTVKRIRGTDIGEGIEALGLIGVIKDISPEKEWPIGSSKILPKMYIIDFPELYKGTKYEGVLLGVPENDLELVSYLEDDKYENQKFDKDDRFINTLNNKKGTICYLRDDSYEKSLRKINSNHFCYSVDYDDGTFETYENQKYMRNI